MGKSATLNLRVDPEVKERAEVVLESLGVPMSTAINMFLRQVSLTGGIPFSVTLPPAPRSINADLMTDKELREKLRHSYKQIEEGKVYLAADVLEKYGADKK